MCGQLNLTAEALRAVAAARLAAPADKPLQLIRRFKNERNPNIVVTGDAELIHVLDFNHQCHVKQTGSLQDKAMRSEVCQVMEGGEEAFERRYQRLGREV